MSIPARVGTLQAWEQDLLQEVHFIKPEDTVREILQNTQCYAASDGSAPKDRGSFGWIISTHKGDHLVRCRGPAYGYAISSYRAEAYGMLSILRFLFRMGETLNPGTQLRALHLVCDNKGLVQSTSKLMHYTRIFPNTTMEPEWDIIAQILDTIKSLGSAAPTIEHIKGHQDVDTPYEQLSLTAQLNCDADAHASAYLRDNPTMEHSISHAFPAGECVLQLRAGTITRDLKYACAEARTLLPLRIKITQDSGWWSHSVFDAVDWSSHGRALQKH